jgi:putative peptidoglycan lipid II flippase
MYQSANKTLYSRNIAIFYIKRLIIPFFIGLGILATFGKEMFLAYYYGTSEAIDIFKTASFLPYSFFQSLGTILVGLYLPEVIKDKANTEKYTGHITKLSFVIVLLGIVLAPFYAGLLAPDFNKEKTNSLVNALIICWVGFFISSFYFHYRIKLQAYGSNQLIAATSLINSLAFILILFLLLSSVETLHYKIEIAFSISILIIMFVYVYSGRHILKFSAIVKNILKPSKSVTITVLLVAMLSHIIGVIPKIIDRAVLSGEATGSISALDYAYNIQTAFYLIVGTSISIIYARKIANEMANNGAQSNKQNIWQPLYLSAAVSTIIALFVYGFSSELVKLVYLRGAFSEESLVLTTDFFKAVIPVIPIVTVNMLIIQIITGTRKVKNIIIPSVFKLLVKAASILFLIYIYKKTNIASAIGISLFLGETTFFILGLRIALKYMK